ncbi:MAG: HDOD domain-containing protein [Acidobacteriia bacterium]|nr:HDOD domain-containing protein [Terriglobia bacterium]
MSVDLEEGRLTKDSLLAAIPAFPPIVFLVLDLLSSDRPDVVPLVEAISSDAAFSAQLLSMANSPQFGLPAQVDSVHRATIKLGFIHIQSLVVAIAITNYRRAARPSEALDKCWRHTLASAVLCRELGRAAGMPADRMYSFGLLHDIGRLGLLAACPDEYNELLQMAGRNGFSLPELERRRFGMDHCETGRRLAERWDLPPELGAIAGHADADSAAALDFYKVVRLGCQLAAALGYGVAARPRPVPFDEILGQLPEAARDQFPANPDALRQLIETAIEEDRVPTAEIVQSPAPARVSQPNSEHAGVDRPEEPSPSARRKHGAARLDTGIILLAAMVVLVLVAGALCLRNG